MNELRQTAIETAGPSGLKKGEDPPEKKEGYLLNFNDLPNLDGNRRILHCYVERTWADLGSLPGGGPHKGIPITFEHHFLMKLVDESPFWNAENKSEEKFRLNIYEMTKDTPALRKHEVVMTRDVYDRVSSKYGDWTISDESFKKDLKAGIRYIPHNEPITKDKVLERAEEFCGEGGHDYHLFCNNCEHFVTACFGLLDGRGWSFQTKKAGNYRIISLPDKPYKPGGYLKLENIEG